MTASYGSTILAPQRNPPPPSGVLAFPERELTRGETLYRTGDPAETFYRIEQGLVKQGIDVLTGKERIVGLAGPGDFIGALTPAQQVYQETATALSPHVVVRVISFEEGHHLLKDEVLTAAGIHIARLQDALEDDELPVTARLARTLLRLGQRFGHTSEEGTVRLTLPLTHENFAAMIGAARETITAILGELRSSGLVQGTRGRYSFDREALSDFAVEASFL